MTQFDDETIGEERESAEFDGPPPQRRSRPWLAITLSIAALCAVALGIFAEDFGFSDRHADTQAVVLQEDEKAFPVKFDDVTFVIAERHFLRIERTVQSRVKSIELALPWPPPTLTFLASETEPAGELSLRDGLFISIQRRTGALTARERLTNIYPVYFDGEPGDGPSDLARHGFLQDTVYEGQELYVGDMEDIAANYLCFETDERLAPALCRGERPVLEGFTAIYRFHRSHLSDWREIEEQLSDLIAQLTLRPSQ